MADNKTTTTTVSTVPSGTVIATDEIGGVDYQRVKLACGPDGTATDVPVGGGVEAAALRVTVASDSTGVLSVDDNGASLTVDNAALAVTGGGVEATALRVTIASDSTGVLSVDDNGGALTVDNAGTFAVQSSGSVAHDAADSGNPVKVGGKARTTNPTAVADADRVDATFDDLGRQVVVLSQVRDLVTHQHTQIASSSSETTIGTAVASTFLDLVSLVITNQTATAVNCTIKDSTAGTTRMIIALPASGGAVMNFPVPVPQATVNNNWTCTLSSAAVTVNIFCQFVKNV